MGHNFGSFPQAMHSYALVLADVRLAVGNAESVVLAPITDGRWSCVHWGQHSPPFMPDPRGMPRPEELESADPMG